MKDSTTKRADGEERPVFGPDTIEAEMRRRVRETIEAIVKEELEAALGAGKSARVGDERQRLSSRKPRADADDQPGTRDDQDAAGANPARGRGDVGVAQ